MVDCARTFSLDREIGEIGAALQPDIWQTILAWALTALLYPGVLFGAALALAAEWVFAGVVPGIAPRPTRLPARAAAPFAPLHNFIKLAGRRGASGLPLSTQPRQAPRASSFVSAAAPVLALSLLPFPGSPITSQTGAGGDLLAVLVLLAAGPAAAAVSQSSAGGLQAQEAGRSIGRLVTGLFPILIAVAALAEASSHPGIRIAALTAAPETAAQFAVRLLAGVALLAALPWWSVQEAQAKDAATYAALMLQRAALSAFWALMVLPAPGDPVWAVILAVGGTLFAYVAMRAIEQRWAPTGRPEDAARRIWATSVPVALAAVIVAALWAGA